MAPPQGQMRPGRQLAVLALLFVVLYLLVFLGGSGSFMDRLEPKLGLDLIGGSRVSYTATTANGQAPQADQLEEARQIIESRANAYGVSEAEVVTEGDRNIVVSLAGESDDALANLGQAAELRFRKVIKVTVDNAAAAVAPSASATPSGTAAPTPSAAGTPTPSASASGGQGGGAPAPSASPSATPTPAPSPTGTGTAEADQSGTRTPEQLLADAKRKVGDAAWAAAAALQSPPDLSTDPAAAAQFEKFSTLDGPEVAVLDPNMQYNVPTIGCAQLNARPPGSIQDPAKQAVSCEASQKLFLDVAKVLGTDVSDANGVLDQQGGDWVVSLDFTGDGQKKWTALTREAYENTSGACDASALGDQGKCRVAVVLDNEVISSPEIQGVLTGDSQITGSFNSKTANELAGKLRYGALPLTFTQNEVQNVSATLGTEHLKAGLLAAGIGMLLVVIYSFFYYRLLGTVIFLSLVLSGLLVFGALIVLGRQIGYTLNLAGIAGFIVSLGVAADSFVIYFERLKDEIREGRSPRSAVPRAWARARRTIISANAITLMAAVVLYIVSVGTVKGFAFALGLATVLDLVVVFLFRHPIMTMFARTRAFLSPRVSGLGRVLEKEPGEQPAKPRNPRVKEA
ncbi:protein translocase subunit SecD [Phytohabitans sp. ZYX-F-186]|uniref:Protein translocase subunit SecD n=1 Tax=Phytohabitans maris TaxID=3071409 RepID=A0ABU0ZNG8_9ACTN|nr:protein translocase subunit SecD [Phytohabitans sp. ZYX-F-186]MDQ7907914.1 protein translocase subunit SecD [Phytohabitans sp. ZYX-F-186]